MTKSELKQVLKPLIKECIKEVIFEEGALSGIITEVAKGLGNVSVAPLNSQPVKTKKEAPRVKSEGVKQAQQHLNEVKKSLQEATGLHGVFEGTTPMTSTGTKPTHGALRDRDPNDPGVDISGIMQIAGGAWNQLK